MATPSKQNASTFRINNIALIDKNEKQIELSYKRDKKEDEFFIAIFELLAKHKLVSDLDFIGMSRKAALDYLFKKVYSLGEDVRIVVDEIYNQEIAILVIENEIDVHPQEMSVASIDLLKPEWLETKILRQCIYLLIQIGANSLSNSYSFDQLENFYYEMAISEIDREEPDLSVRYREFNDLKKLTQKNRKDLWVPFIRVSDINGFYKSLSKCKTKEVVDYAMKIIDLFNKRFLFQKGTAYTDDRQEDRCSPEDAFVISYKTNKYIDRIINNISEGAYHHAPCTIRDASIYTTHKTWNTKNYIKNTKILCDLIDTKYFDHLCQSSIITNQKEC